MLTASSLKNNAWLFFALSLYLTPSKTKPAFWEIANHTGKKFKLFLDHNPRKGENFASYTWKEWALEKLEHQEKGTIQIMKRPDNSGFVDYFCDTPFPVDHPLLLATHTLQFHSIVENQPIITSTYTRSGSAPLRSAAPVFVSPSHPRSRTLSQGHYPSFPSPIQANPFAPASYGGHSFPFASCAGPAPLPYNFYHHYSQHPSLSFHPAGPTPLMGATPPYTLHRPPLAPIPTVAPQAQPSEPLTFATLLQLVESASKEEKARLQALLGSSLPDTIFSSTKKEDEPVSETGSRIPVISPAPVGTNTAAPSPAITSFSLPDSISNSAAIPSSPTPSSPRELLLAKEESSAPRLQGAWTRRPILQQASLARTQGPTAPILSSTSLAPVPEHPLETKQKKEDKKQETLHQKDPERGAATRKYPEIETAEKANRAALLQEEVQQEIREEIPSLTEKEKRLQQAQRDREANATKRAQKAAHEKERKKQANKERKEEKKRAASQSRRPAAADSSTTSSTQSAQSEEDALIAAAIAENQETLATTDTPFSPLFSPTTSFKNSLETHRKQIRTLLESNSYLPARVVIEKFLRNKSGSEIFFIFSQITDGLIMALYYEALRHLTTTRDLKIPLTIAQFKFLADHAHKAIAIKITQLEAMREKTDSHTQTVAYVQRVHDIALHISKNPYEEQTLSSHVTFACLLKDPAHVPFSTICAEFKSELDKVIGKIYLSEDTFSTLVSCMYKLFELAPSPDDLLLAVEATSVHPNLLFVSTEALILFLQSDSLVALTPDQLLSIFIRTHHQIDRQIESLRATMKIAARPEFTPLLEHLTVFLPVLTQKIETLRSSLTSREGAAAAATTPNFVTFTRVIQSAMEDTVLSHILANGKKERQLKIVEDLLSFIETPAHVPYFVKVFSTHHNTLGDDLQIVVRKPELKIDPTIRKFLITELEEIHPH